MLIPKDPDDSKNIVMELRLELWEMKQAFLQEICLECTQNIVRKRLES